MPPLQIEVRPPLPGEDMRIAEVSASAVATLRQTYHPTPAAIARKRRMAKTLKRLVALIDDQIVGTLQYRLEDQAIHLMGPMVHHDHRRLGIARALVDAAAQIARQAHLARLSLHTIKQTGNVPIFEKLGFHLVSEQIDALTQSATHPTLIDVYMEHRL